MPGPRRWCCLVKNKAFDLVGVPLVLSSLSDKQLKGFELPDRLGPGLAIEEYPLEDELKFDSEVVLWIRMRKV